jgi:cytochrome P450
MARKLLLPGTKSKSFAAPQGMTFRRDPLNFLTYLAREKGDVARFRIGSERAFLLNHPDFIKDVLVTRQANFTNARAPLTQSLLGEGLLTSEGDFHRRQRRLAQPAFHRERMGGYAMVMANYAERLGERWQDDETLDVSDEMMRLMLCIVGKTLFDADVERDAGEIGAAMAEIRDLFEKPRLPHSKILREKPPALRLIAASRKRANAWTRLSTALLKSGEKPNLITAT